MNYFFINLKRFDVPNEVGGVNYNNNLHEWAPNIVKDLNKLLRPLAHEELSLGLFLPELHLLNATQYADEILKIGAQSVSEKDVKINENFGALTSHRSALAMKYAGCSYALIGHIEERRTIDDIYAIAGISDRVATNTVLNRRMLAAQNAGLQIVYCIGESENEQQNWQEVLSVQLEVALKNIDTKNLIFAYEPVWAIGPGKNTPDKDYIEKIATFIKEKTNNLPVIYGGGLKKTNAAMVASCHNIDGGLIALTSFEGKIGFNPSEAKEVVETYLNSANE